MALCGRGQGVGWGWECFFLLQNDWVPQEKALSATACLSSCFLLCENGVHIMQPHWAHEEMQGTQRLEEFEPWDESWNHGLPDFLTLTVAVSVLYLYPKAP